MVVGCAVGAGISLIFSSVTEAFAGVIGGATIGALLGMITVTALLGAFGLITVIIPNTVFLVISTVGALAGGVIGAIFLRNIMMKIFGLIGGGIVSIGSLGMALGLFAGLKMSNDAEE